MMRLQILLSALLFAPGLSNFICTICENDGAITIPSGMVTTLEGQKATCAALSQHISQLPSASCKEIQAVAGAPCGCPGFEAANTEDENDEPEESEDYLCSICGEGEMKNPTGFTVSSQGMPISCQDLHDSRHTISESACERIQSLASVPCGCDNGYDIAENVAPEEPATNSTCSICGSGFIRNPKGFVLNDRGTAKTCADLEAKRANIPRNMCSSVQESALEPCGCDFNQLIEGAGESPFVCSVCGEGRIMVNGEATVQIADGQDPVQCAALEVNAHKFGEDQCPDIQSIANESCGCVLPEVSETSGAFEIQEAVSECSICGNGEMSIPSGIVTTPQGKSASCEVLHQNAKQITQRACETIQALSKEPCGCVTTDAEDDIDSVSEVNSIQCDICEGGQMTNPEGIVTTPEGQAGRCSVLAANAHTIPQDSCHVIQQLAYDKCGCIRPESGTTVNNESVSVPNVDPSDICHVCGGPAGQVGNPGKMITTPTGIFTCQSVFNAGLEGTIPSDQCGAVQSEAARNCGCSIDGPTVAPTEASQKCSVCADDMVVTIPEGIIDSSNNMTCAQYEQEIAEGKLSEDQCVILQIMSKKACGCEAPPSPPTMAPTSYKCEICGRGRMVGNPDATFVLPNFMTMSCATMQRRSEYGTIHRFQCEQYQPFVLEHCGCVDDPNYVGYECSICANGQPTNPEGIVSIPSQPDRTCAELMESGARGDIDENQCALLHPYVETPCGCPSNEATSTVVESGSEEVGNCFASLKDILVMEREITDTAMKRKYVLCPNTAFDMGVWSDDGEITDGEPFLALRPNVIYQCGQNGSRSNNCILRGGDFGLASYYEVFKGIHEHIPGVQVRGLTFESQNMFSVLLKSAGDITFTDCAFKGNSNNAPVLLQWEEMELESPDSAFPLLDLEDTSRLKQVVTFQDCVFRDNSIDESMSFPGVIENTFNSELIVKDCLFENNSYGSTKNPADSGYAIRSFGPLTLESSCFIDNEFFNHGPVLVYGAQYSAVNNYVESAQTDLTCELGALFSSKDEFEKVVPACELSDASTCAFSPTPTSSPTTSPQTAKGSPSSSKPHQVASSASRTTRSSLYWMGAMALSAALAFTF